MRRLSLVLLAACGGGGSDEPSTPAAEPDALAAAVSQAELSGSIQGLEALETRFTMGDGDDRAKDYLVGRFTQLGLTAELDPFPVAGETATNIIVKHPGTVTPEVVHLFSAHYDSTSPAPMTDAPGATCRNSGCSTRPV